jgi:hypothetical protein
MNGGCAGDVRKLATVYTILKRNAFQVKTHAEHWCLSGDPQGPPHKG